MFKEMLEDIIGRTEGSLGAHLLGHREGLLEEAPELRAYRSRGLGHPLRRRVESVRDLKVHERRIWELPGWRF